MESVTTTKRSADTEDRKHHGQQRTERPDAFFFKSRTEVSHWTARHAAFFVFCSVHLTECTFGELGTHPEQSNKDHPERCSGAALADRDRDAGNVSQSDCSG